MKKRRYSHPRYYVHPPVDKIVALYQSGMTQKEVGTAFGVSQKVVQTRLRDAGVKCRTAAKRFQRGPDNDSWKGDNAGYQAFHRRLDARWGRPRRCEVCGLDDPFRKYYWANLSGHYNDPWDYLRMCSSCHSRYDRKQKNFKGAVGGRASPQKGGDSKCLKTN